jgi:hypothetical protein
MKGKTNIVVAAGVAVLVLMFSGAAFLLARGFSQFSSAGKKAEAQFKKLEAFYRRDPFPSAGNVEIAQTNATQLSEWYRKLSDDLAKGDLKVTERSPTMFMRRLQDTRNQLLLEAPKRGVVLKAEFAFGFDRYLSGGESSLPAPEVVPQLTQQLALVERISGILLASRVASLDAVEREDLESLTRAGAALQESEGEGDRRQKRAGPSSGQPSEVAEAVAHTKMTFAVDFTANESALIEVLNALARDPVVIVVKSLSFRREWPDVLEGQKPAPPAAGAQGVPAAIPERQERMVSGPATEKPARVRLEIEVYRFSGDESGESA